jgi:8-oxo-dGTP diphosphatase
MHYAISAGTIVIRDGRLLLVHHRGGGEDFWVPPGGRLRGEESILECAARETREETRLVVVPKRILYVEEFLEGDLHFCKFWILASDPGGDVSLAGLDPDEVHVIDVRFVSKDESTALRLYPRILRDGFWKDLDEKFPETRYLGLQQI